MFKSRKLKILFITIGISMMGMIAYLYIVRPEATPPKFSPENNTQGVFKQDTKISSIPTSIPEASGNGFNEETEKVNIETELPTYDEPETEEKSANYDKILNKKGFVQIDVITPPEGMPIPSAMYSSKKGLVALVYEDSSDASAGAAGIASYGARGLSINQAESLVVWSTNGEAVPTALLASLKKGIK